MNAKELRDLSDNVFGKRMSLLSLWQEQAENFYPERADFTFKRYLGDDFAGNLTTSYPILVRRDLGDQVGQMLRQTAKPWFHMSVLDSRREDNDARRWLEWATGLQRRAMYDRSSLFTRATKEGDNDYSTFGQCVISGRLNRARDGLLYRCWHLRDVAWVEDEEGKTCPIFRRWKPNAQDLTKYESATFKLHSKVKEIAAKTPFEEIDCLHMIVPAEMYDGDARGKPYWSIYYDCVHQMEMEAVAVWNKEYAIPRWQTVSGSQYAYSPATIAALPDARLLQAMTFTLLEAGEKVTNPPMVGTLDAVRSDVAVYAGGFTWVDMEYDEKLGEALRPLNIDASGMPLGLEMAQDTRRLLAQAFYLNKLTLPQRAPEMTAYEVGQRIQQYIRDALPLFEPMEAEYNGQICELTFDLLLRNGAFGAPQDMPKSLQGADIQFRFASPLHDAIEEQKGQKFLESKALIADAAAIDKSVIGIIDAKAALRDALNGIGTPAKWLRSEIEVKAMDEQQQQKQAAAEMLSTLQQGADIAKTAGEAAQTMSPAMA